MPSYLCLTAVVVTAILCAWVHTGLVWFDAHMNALSAPIVYRVTFVVLTAVIVAVFAHSLT